MKALVLKRMVVEMASDGTDPHVLLQYQVAENGVLLDPRRISSVNVDQGITGSNLQSIISEAKASAEESEGV